MTQRHKIQLFEDKKVRTAWDDEREEWYFSIVDVCGVLTESKDPQTYWRVLKNRLKKEGNETVTNCNALKMQAYRLLLTGVGADWRMLVGPFFVGWGNKRVKKSAVFKKILENG